MVTDTRIDDAERKQVTVLFADVKGSMDLAEQQDPEEWRKIMQRFFSILTEAVERFDGTVDKFTGDGIMAIFGAPVSFEDHAPRACYSALQILDDVGDYAGELRREQGLNFSVRVGINSGEVVAGAIGSGDDGAYTAIGHTVGLAQRMEALAEPGKAYLTDQAAELARGYLALEDLGEFEIKGASRPIPVFELAGIGDARSRLDRSREQGFSRFVGRSEELAAFEAALADAHESRGSVLGVVADPGIGKSRLCFEFAEQCRAQGIEVFEAQAQAHGRSIPFMPVLQMLRAYFGIGEREPERQAREKIAGRALLLDPGFAEDLPIIFDFLGVPDPDRPVPPMSAEARQRALGGFVCRLVNSPNRRSTVVVLIEDLHWIDEASGAMLGELVGSVEGTSTLAIVNFRPEYKPDWGGSTSFRRLELEPLVEGATGEMLRDLAGEDPSLDGLAELVHDRARGNPFFVEEIVRELAEAGFLEGERGAYRLARPVEDAGVPTTVQAILTARIDRLSPTAKQLLQVASVVGKEGGARALQLTAGLDPDELDPPLAELIEAGFLYEAELYPERILAFRHPLTREVAYGTQLGDRREASHAATARAMIELEPERHDELAALIAQHMESGGETREAARWSARAAYWTGGSQPVEALRLWQAVTRLADELEQSDESDALGVMSRLQQIDYAWRLGMDREEEQRLAAEAEEIAVRTDNRHALALLKMAVRARPGLVQTSEQWRASADEAVRLADESGDLNLRVAIRTASSYARLCAGDLDGFEEILDEVLDLAGDDLTTGELIVIGNPVSWALMGKGMVRRERGETKECEELCEEALRIAEEEEDPETASWIRGCQTLARCQAGDIEGANAIARRNCELTDRIGDVFSRSVALSNLAITELAAEDHAAALASIEEADRLYREAMGNGGEMETWRDAIRAEALLGVGRTDDAAEVAAHAVAVGRERGMLWSLPLALLAFGRARLANDDGEGAREIMEEAAELARARGVTPQLEAIEETLESIGAEAR